MQALEYDPALRENEILEHATVHTSFGNITPDTTEHMQCCESTGKVLKEGKFLEKEWMVGQEVMRINCLRDSEFLFLEMGL